MKIIAFDDTPFTYYSICLVDVTNGIYMALCYHEGDRIKFVRDSIDLRDNNDNFRDSREPNKEEESLIKMLYKWYEGLIRV